MIKTSRDDAYVSKSPRGRKLMAALLQELHRRGIAPVKGDLKQLMRYDVARKIEAEDNGDTRGVRSWSRIAADADLAKRE